MNLAIFRWRQALAIALCLLRYGAAGFALYVSLEYTDDALCALINACLFLLPFTLLLALTGRWVMSLSGASAFAIFLYGLGELKFKYFGNRLAVADYTFLAEPANWSIVSRYPLLYGTLSAFVLGLMLLALDAWLAGRKRRPLSARARVLAVLLCAGLALSAYTSRHHHLWEVWRDDADCGSLHTCGVMARLMYSISMFELEPARHEGDPGYFLSQMAALPAQDTGNSGQTAAPDIVVWLNESTFDPRNFRLPGAKLPLLEMFDETPRTRAAGLMRVHTFGGKTWLSEFSMLTGLVPDDFGARRNLVFNAVGPKTNFNLVRLLKANGYKAIVLMPTFKHFYGAGRTYEGMGFDQVLTLRDFHEYDQIPGDEWDIADSDRLAEAAQTLFKRHRAGPEAAKPLFLYMLSVKEHAPYSKKTPVAYNLSRAGISPTLAAKLTDYIGKLRLLNGGIRKLDAYLASPGSRRALFVYFGDHQAYYEEDSPPYRYNLPDPKDITQFQIRANFQTPATPPVPLLDIAFIPSLIADFSGVRKDAYFEALSAMRRLCSGKLDECEDAPLLQSYKAYVFSRELGQFRE